jgi:adenylylsulfate kinase
MGFTGVDDPYEAPTKPEITLKNYGMPREQVAAQVLQYLEQKGLLPSG